MGTISDALKSTYGIESLRYAAVGSLVFYALAAVLALPLSSRCEMNGRRTHSGTLESDDIKLTHILS